MKWQRDLSKRKKMIKMTTNSQLSTTEPKKKQNKLSKQLGQEQNHRNADHMVGYWRGWRGENGGKVQGIRSINCRYKTDKGRLRIV